MFIIAYLHMSQVPYFTYVKLLLIQAKNLYNSCYNSDFTNGDRLKEITDFPCVNKLIKIRTRI